MVRSFIRLLLIALIGLVIVAPAAPALAATNPFGDVDCSKAHESVVCRTPSGGDPINGSKGVLHKVINLIAIFAGTVAVIFMILGGFYYISSDGDAEQVSRAKKTLIYAGVGLVVIAVGQTIIKLVLSKI